MFCRIIFSLIIISSLTLFSQKKKEVKKYRIKSVTSTETSGGTTINDSKTIFETSGRVEEEINYDKAGVLKTAHKFKYDSNGEVIEDSEFERGNLKEKRVFKYNGLGEKVEESIYDKDNKLTKKSVYSYNAKGLRIEKKTFDGSGVLISVKKYSYEFK